MTETVPLTLAEWMIARNLKPRHVWRALGCSRAMVWSIRSGKRRATGDFKLEFARAYGRAAAAELWPEDFAEPFPKAGA